MDKRKTFDYYEDGERKFKLNAYDPMEGNYILMQLYSSVLPMGIGRLVGKMLGDENAVSNFGESKMMPKEEFLAFQTDILKTIEEVYRSGETSPVVRENGTYGISDPSMSLLIKLIVASLAFNFKDFFLESQLEEM